MLASLRRESTLLAKELKVARSTVAKLKGELASRTAGFDAQRGEVGVEVSALQEQVVTLMQQLKNKREEEARQEAEASFGRKSLLVREFLNISKRVKLQKRLALLEKALMDSTLEATEIRESFDVSGETPLLLNLGAGTYNQDHLVVIAFQGSVYAVHAIGDCEGVRVEPHKNTLPEALFASDSKPWCCFWTVDGALHVMRSAYDPEVGHFNIMVNSEVLRPQQNVCLSHGDLVTFQHSSVIYRVLGSGEPSATVVEVRPNIRDGFAEDAVAAADLPLTIRENARFKEMEGEAAELARMLTQDLDEDLDDAARSAVSSPRKQDAWMDGASPTSTSSPQPRQVGFEGSSPQGSPVHRPGDSRRRVKSAKSLFSAMCGHLVKLIARNRQFGEDVAIEIGAQWLNAHKQTHVVNQWTRYFRPFSPLLFDVEVSEDPLAGGPSRIIVIKHIREEDSRDDNALAENNYEPVVLWSLDKFHSRMSHMRRILESRGWDPLEAGDLHWSDDPWVESPDTRILEMFAGDLLSGERPRPPDPQDPATPGGPESVEASSRTLVWGDTEEGSPTVHFGKRRRGNKARLTNAATVGLAPMLRLRQERTMTTGEDEQASSPLGRRPKSGGSHNGQQSISLRQFKIEGWKNAVAVADRDRHIEELERETSRLKQLMDQHDLSAYHAQAELRQRVDELSGAQDAARARIQQLEKANADLTRRLCSQPAQQKLQEEVAALKETLRRVLKARQEESKRARAADHQTPEPPSSQRGQSVTRALPTVMSARSSPEHEVAVRMKEDRRLLTGTPGGVWSECFSRQTMSTLTPPPDQQIQWPAKRPQGERRRPAGRIW
mmetsp:Transcript_55981/g.149296  ORF Transcript_55981/g.149296 Transcript_55981/m.149296 type:complete len:836 (+) Transcript_55981:74-2581(+)